MPRKRSQGICGLCGDRSEVTREHFVPQCLWPDLLPARTETIPACVRCNEGSNLDDEYFRNALVMTFDFENPQKEQLFQGPVLRSLKRHPGMVADMLRQMRIRPLVTPAGLWLGNYPTLQIDGERYCRSLVKIIKGLYFLIRKQPFPADGQIVICAQLCAETLPLINMIEQNLSPTFDFGDNVFEWRFWQNKEGVTGWKLSFYRSVSYYAIGFEHKLEWQALKDSKVTGN